MTLRGCATPEATAAYAARFGGEAVPGHFRLTVDGLQVSSGSGYFEDLQARSSRWYRVDLDGAQMERVDLRGARLQSCDLSNARLERCDIRGLTINGHNIEELIKKAER